MQQKCYGLLRAMKLTQQIEIHPQLSFHHCFDIQPYVGIAVFTFQWLKFRWDQWHSGGPLHLQD